MKTKIILIAVMIMAGAVLYAADVKTTTPTAVTWEHGTGHPNPAGHQRNFVDNNKDGISDRFVDANKDGKCDTFVNNNNTHCGNNTQHMGRHNNTSGSGIGMHRGEGMGKGRHGR